MLLCTLRWALLGAAALAVIACGSSDTAPAGAASGGAAGTSSGGAGGSTSAGGSGGASSGGDGGTSAGTGGGGGQPGPSLGDPVTGQFHLGPVEWSGSFSNSCAPYPDSIQSLEGSLLAGLGLSYNGDGQLCDACIQVDTDEGKSAVLRVVTTGQTNEPGDIDVSSAAYALLDSGEYPRSMTWHLVDCGAGGSVYYQFQTGANVWWTSLWVRNARLPVEKVEVKSANHSSWFALTRGQDGTWTDGSGFGDGSFTLRVTAATGATIEDTFSAFSPGDLLESSVGQFP